MAPEIQVTFGQTNIESGDAPASGKGTDFGSVVVGQTSSASTFTVTNAGTSSLTIASVALSGTHASDFGLDTTSCPDASVLAVSGTCSFAVTVTPSALGVRSATVVITSDDGDEATFNLLVEGTGVAPEIQVAFGQTNIESGDAAATGKGTDFGSVVVGQTSSASTFTVTNAGTSSLTIASVALSGTHASDFGLDTTSCPDASVLAISGTCTFAVTVTPSALGARSATVVITSDDGDEATFNLLVEGTGVAPEIDVEGGSPLTAITSGTTATSTTDGTDFENVLLGETGSSTFTVTNSGTSDLAVAPSW